MAVASTRRAGRRAFMVPQTLVSLPSVALVSHAFGSPRFSQTMMHEKESSRPSAAAASSSASSSDERASVSALRSIAGACRDTCGGESGTYDRMAHALTRLFTDAK